MIRKLVLIAAIAAILVPYAVCYYFGRAEEVMYRWCVDLDAWANPDRLKLPRKPGAR